MKKVLLLFFMFLILFGCSKKNGNNFDSTKNLLKKEGKVSILKDLTNFKKYYSYYLDPAIHLSLSDDLSSIFDYDGYKFSLNVNISGIVNQEHFNGVNNFDDDSLKNNEVVFSFKDYYVGIDDQKHDYIYQVYHLGDFYYIYMVSSNLISQALVSGEEIENISLKMLHIMRNTKVEEKEIVNNYSLKDEISYHKKDVDLFKTLAPTKGRVEDIIKTNKNNLEKDIKLNEGE